MKQPENSTFGPSITSDAYAKQFRDQATGIGQTRSASQMTGARRSQCVIDCAPPAQLKVRDRSYPAPNPRMIDGVACDAVTLRPVVQTTLY